MENDIKSTLFTIRERYPKDRVSKGLRDDVDKVIDNPEVKANKVLELIKPVLDANNLEVYDVLCFAAGYLLASAAEYTFLKDEVIEVQKLIIVYHYLYMED